MSLLIDPTNPEHAELTHMVLIHKEHDRSAQRRIHLCLDHYMLAESCDMIDVDYGLALGWCFFCSTD
jgi:hypothetical protein